MVPKTIWKWTRLVAPNAERTDALAAHLRAVTGLGDDADRVARCIIDFLSDD
jgi:hypothetical protein